MNDLTPTMIRSRFKKSMTSTTDYCVQATAEIDKSPLISMVFGPNQYTHIFVDKIVGEFQGSKMDLPFDSVTKYSFWDEDSQILAKEKLPEAVSILVNDTCNFWIPNDATYAFSNLLNLLVKSNLSRQ